MNLLDGLAERGARFEVEGDRGRGDLAVVVDGLRTGLRHDAGHRIERDQLARGILEIEHRKRVGILLIARFELEQHLVLVDGAVNGRNPARAVRIVKRIFDGVGVDVHGRGFIPVHRNGDLRSRHGYVAGHVLDAGDLGDFFGQRLGLSVELSLIRSLQ